MQVKQKGLETGDRDLVEILGCDEPPDVTPAEVLPALQDRPAAFLVLKATEGTGQNHEHNPFAWKFVIDLRACIAKHELNSLAAVAAGS